MSDAFGSQSTACLKWHEVEKRDRPSNVSRNLNRRKSICSYVCFPITQFLSWTGPVDLSKQSWQSWQIVGTSEA